MYSYEGDKLNMYSLPPRIQELHLPLRLPCLPPPPALSAPLMVPVCFRSTDRHPLPTSCRAANMEWNAFLPVLFWFDVTVHLCVHFTFLSLSSSIRDAKWHMWKQ